MSIARAVPDHVHRRPRDVLTVGLAALVAFGVMALMIAGAALLTRPDPGASAESAGPQSARSEGEAATVSGEPPAPTPERRTAVGLLLLLTTLGFNFAAWGLVGFVRLADEKLGPGRALAAAHPAGSRRVPPGHLAVVMAAHNEEVVIVSALDALLGLVDYHDVYIANDGSTDATSALARRVGVNVLDVHPNRGKAGALRAALEHFDLLDGYEAVLFLDADTHLDPGYLDAALPLLDDPDVAAVAGYAQPLWRDRQSWWGRLIATHRHRLYAVTQILQKYGQTWRFTNVAYIVPGFASIYRTSALRRIDMDPPGLVIEDFNMTFEIHRHRLGRIAFTPAVLARCHEPESYRDYARQVRRWALGFWQTVRRHGIWPGAFWAALCLWIVEVVLVSIVFAALPLVVILLALPELVPAVLSVNWFAAPYGVLAAWVSLPLLLGAVMLPDVVVTTVLGVRERRPLYPLLALLLPVLRITDGVVGLATLPKAWTQTSNGVWESPSRGTATTATPPTLATGGGTPGQAPKAPAPVHNPVTRVPAPEAEGRVDLNTAPLSELRRITAIGQHRAELIVALRPLTSVQDLARLPNIRPAEFAKIVEQDLAYVAPPPLEPDPAGVSGGGDACG